jgi:DNA-binding MarR family transcriptional regulator
MAPTAEDTKLLDEWRELLERHARVNCALEHALEQEHGLGVSEFEVLDELATSKKDTHRIQELADAVHLSQSALSRVVARLEDQGLVTRSMCTEDRRGIYACLTDAGKKRHAKARPTHRQVLQENLSA